ncbi:MAG TPA: glucose-6-phosphate dehydrogenase assembly protein OpcA [Candidatus Baltobacteraceae bacterium]
MSLDVGAILDELAKDRKERIGVSATSLNLVAFVEDPQLLGWLKERTGTIAQRHPSRTLLLDATHADSARSVYSAVKEIDDTVLTQTEQIELGVRDFAAEELGSIVRALTVPNVQTILCWAGAHIAGESRFTELTRLADSVLLDSSRGDKTAGTLRELTQWMAGGSHRAVRDLAYMRLAPWQDMIAQFFDDADLASELPSIERVAITSGSDAEAYYLIGWLASRLQWNPCGAHEFCNARGEKIGVSFRHQGEARRVVRIVLESAHSTFTAALQKGTSDVVCLSVDGKKARPQRCAPIHDVDVVSLMEQAILTPAGGELFAASLEAARALLEAQSPAS